MDNAQKAMGGLGKTAGGIGASIGKIAAGFGVFKAISGTIRLLSSGFSSLTSELNESSIAWQTFESNMAMLGKSSGEIDSTRKSLEQFAQQTIYSASDMASTYSQMAAIGVDDTEKLVKAMGGLAASAENPQQAMKTLSQQMTQAMAKPTLSWADFKLMLEQTPAGMAEVAKEMGYALDDFVVAVQDGEIASKDFAKAVSEVGTNEHFGAMATEFKSVGQAMDGARETIANKLMPAFEMLSAIGIKAISSLTDWIDTLDFSGLLAPIESLASMFGVATDEMSAMTDTIQMSSDEIQSVADNWESMTLAEKQATVQTMGQEDLAELLDMLGVDFESIPDEYTKDAFLNTHGKDALEEILWVTGKWHDLTLEEKRAVLEAQIDNKGLAEAIDNMGLWENAEFVSKFAEINMNDNDSGQQVLDLINYYRELDGQEPIELEVDVKTKPAERAVDKFTTTFKKFGKSLGKISKGIGKATENIGEFFSPVFDHIGEVFQSNLKTFGKYVDAIGQLFEGDWAGAWKTFKDATVENVSDVVKSLKKNVPKMWDSLKVTAGNVWEWFDNISWSNVYDAINGFFNDMGAVIATIDWVAVAGEVGGVVGDFVSATTAWLDENVPKAIDWVLVVLLNPNSKLNKDAGAFKAEVEGALDVFMAELLDLERDFFVNLRAEPIFSWERWNRLFQEAEQKLIRDTVNFQNTIQQWFKAFDNPELEVSILAQILNLEHQGWSDEEIQAEIDRIHGDGTYEFQMTLRPSANVEELDIGEQLEIIQNAYGSNKAVEILQEVKAEIELAESEGTSPEDIQSQINEKYGTGMYEVVTDIATKIGELEAGGITEQEFWKSLGELYDLDIAVPAEITPEAEVNTSNITGDTLQQKLDNILADQTMTVDQKIEMIYELLEGQGIEEGYIENYLREQFPGHTFDLEAGLKVTPTSMVLGMSTQPTFDTGGVDLSAETSQKATIMTDNGELKVVELSVDENNLPVIDPIDVTNEVPLTGTGSMDAPQVDFSGMIADAQSAMQQVNQAITAGMTNVASAVRMGTVMMNVAFRSGMNQAIITAQNTANRVVSVFSNLASRLSSAGMMAGAGFRNGLASQSSSIISTAQSIANSVSNTIQSALRIASPSKVTTYLGEMVGAGLIAGMDGMVSGVESSANRLSLATLPTTDLGSSRYSGSISGQSTSSKLDEVIDAINRGQVIMMDSGALVGETSKQMDVALGQRGSLGGRHKL